MKRDALILGLAFAFLLIFNSVSGSVFLNEIIYHPSDSQGGDSYGEWIEIYNNNSFEINLTGWKISDRKTDNLSVEYNRTLTFFNDSFIQPYSYFIIAKNKNNFTYYWNFSEHVAQSSIVLNNGPEIIRLYSSNGSLESEFYYNDSFGADGDGNSLQRFNETFWCVNIPTPGMLNNCSKQNEPNQTNERQIKILNYPHSVLNNGTEFNILTNFLFFSNVTYDVKVYVRDINNETIGRIYNPIEDEWQDSNNYIQDAFTINLSNFNYSMKLKIDPAKNYTGDATLQVAVRYANTSNILEKSDLYSFYVNASGNNNTNGTNETQNEKRVVLTYPSTVDCNSSFTINLQAYNLIDGIYDVKIDALSELNGNRVGEIWNYSKWISSNFYKIATLNVTNFSGQTDILFKVDSFNGNVILTPSLRKTGSSSSTSFDDYSIGVSCSQDNEGGGNNDNQENDSSLEITDYPEDAKFGDSIKIDIKIYRGSTSKYAVYAYVEDSNEKKVSETSSLHINSKFSEFEGTIELSLKCLDQEGTYKIVLEGLDEKTSKKIQLTSCNDVAKKQNTSTVADKKNPSTTSSSLSDSVSTNRNSVQNKDSNSITGSTISDTSSSTLKFLPYLLVGVALALALYVLIKKI